MTEQEFLQTARERFGARGLRQAKAFLDKPVRDHMGITTPMRDSSLFPVMSEIWLDSKEDARERFTPKKYRK